MVPAIKELAGLVAKVVAVSVHLWQAVDVLVTVKVEMVDVV